MIDPNFEKFQELGELTRPVRDWLAKNGDPHTKIIVTYNRADLVRELVGVSFEIPD